MDMTNTRAMRQQFWTQLLRHSNACTPLFANTSPSQDTWIDAGAGVSGINYNYVINLNAARVELDIDCGDRTMNKAAFDTLRSKQSVIEQAFGDALDWRRQDEYQASKISYRVVNHGLRDQTYWPTVQEAMVDAMIRLEQALHPHIQQTKR
jgi:hypothetical protein